MFLHQRHLPRLIDLGFVFVMGASFMGCAHSRLSDNQNPDKLFELACNLGKDLKQVKGNVWIKANSKDAKGQLPALVLAQAPDHLKLEATNLLGSTVASITVDRDRFEIKSPKKNEVKTGVGNWAGIPLQWATQLFLGRLPCPESSKFSRAMTPEGDLLVQTSDGSESYQYRFKSWNGSPWVEALSWKKTGIDAQSVDFTFDSPDDATQTAKEWKAKSEAGEIHVWWREREASR